MIRFNILKNINIYLVIIILIHIGAFFNLMPFGDAIQKITVVCILAIGIMGKKRIAIRNNEFIYLSIYIACITAEYLHGSYTFQSPVRGLYVIQQHIMGLVIFFWVRSCNIKKLYRVPIVKYFYYIVSIQIFIIIIKYFKFGVSEGVWVGSMTNTAGQIGFIFPALCIPIVFCFTNNRSNLMSTAVIIGLIFFSIVSEKRAGVILLPIIIAFSYVYINQLSLKNIFSLKSSPRKLLGLLLGSIVIYWGVNSISSLSSEITQSNQSSINSIYEYIIQYTFAEYGGPLQGGYDLAWDRNAQLGRGALLLWILDYVLNGDIYLLLFGLGSGEITPSYLLGNSKDVLFQTVGVRGAMSGILMVLLERGVLGVFAAMVGWVGIYLHISKAKNRVVYYPCKRWLKAVYCLYWIFMFDFFIYSDTMLRVLPLPFIFWAVIASVYMTEKYDKWKQVGYGQRGLTHGKNII
jgi:hypothetical protein